MDDYTSRQAALEAVCADCSEKMRRLCGLDSNHCKKYNAVKSAPSADVLPVVRGKWLAKSWILESETGEVEIPYDKEAIDQWGCFCSNCGVGALLDGNEKVVPSNYCPNCGAKMGGDT